jgi:DNA topoisomerase IA
MFISKTLIAGLCIVSALGGSALSGFIVYIRTDCVAVERSMQSDTDKNFEARKNNWGPSEDF